MSQVGLKDLLGIIVFRDGGLSFFLSDGWKMAPCYGIKFI